MKENQMPKAGAVQLQSSQGDCIKGKGEETVFLRGLEGKKQTKGAKRYLPKR